MVGREGTGGEELDGFYNSTPAAIDCGALAKRVTAALKAEKSTEWHSPTLRR